MNTKIANSLSGYIETLYIMNQKLIKLCGIDIIDKYEHSYKLLLDIIQDIHRVIPYKFNFDSNKIELEQKGGLLEYKNDINYLNKEYQELLNNNYDFLDKIRVIRNKYEHKMHDVKRKSSGSGSTSYFDFEFDVSGKSITVEAYEFI